MRRLLGVLVVAMAAAALIEGIELGRSAHQTRPTGVGLDAAVAADNAEGADQVTPGTFTGAFDPNGICGVNTFQVGAGTATIDVAVTATLPTNDIALTLLDPGGNPVGSSDVATSPEAVHYAASPVAAGTWTAKVCPSANPAGPFLEPYTYVGTFVTTDLPVPAAPGMGGPSAAGAPAGTPAPSRVAGSLSFSPETVIDPQRTEGEPVNFFAPDGSYWESGPFGTSTQQSWVHRSTDGGLEFHELSPLGVRPDAPPGGGDSDVVVDDQGYAYFTDLEGLVNVSTSVSNDGGNTWRKNSLGAQEVGVDREWYAIDDGTTLAASDNTVFLTYRQVPLGPQILSSPGSTGAGDDVGGLVWTNAASPASQLAVSSGAPCGKLIFDPVRRNLYLPCGQSGAHSTDHIELVIGHVAPGQRTNIDFHTVELPASPGGGGVNTVFPWIAADKAGNLMAVWIDRSDRQVYETTSTDGGQTWTAPVQVNSAPARTNTFPEVAGGDAGTFVVAWYGNDSTTDSDHQPENTAANSSDFPWYGYVAVVSHADGLAPTIAQQRFTSHPMHYGFICNSGTTCTSGRTMADYFDVGIDQHGAIRLVFDDESTQFRQAHLMEVRELFGPAPGNPMSDPTGDAQVPHYSPTGPGPNLPQLDFTKLALSHPSAGVLRVEMTLSSLANLSPPPGKSSIVWLTRFQARSTMANGAEAYRLFYVGARSTAGGPVSFFAGSPDDPGGCLDTSAGCKVVIYPAQQALTSGDVSGDTITVDVSLDNGLGGAKVLGSTLYGVTAFSYGENGDADLYAEGDATHSFDYALGGTPVAAPQPTAAPSGGKGGVKGTSTAKSRSVRGRGVVRALGGVGTATFSIGAGNRVTYVDARRHIRFSSTHVSVRFGVQAARLTGTGVVNGRRVTFAAVAVDHGARGDVFRIDWSHGIARGGVLLRGNVLIS
jgi:hypothetical protein